MSGSVEEVMSRVGELQEQMQAQLTPLRINNVLGEEIHWIILASNLREIDLIGRTYNAIFVS